MRKKCKPDSKLTLLNISPRIQASAPWIAPQTFDLRVERLMSERRFFSSSILVSSSYAEVS